MPVAAITGAGKRLGLAIAARLLDEGHDLLLCVNRSRDGAEALADTARSKGRRAQVFSADLSQADAVVALGAQLAEAAPALDVLVNNAGLFERTPFADVTESAFRRMMAVNIDAPFLLTQALLAPLTNAAHGGVVVNVVDIAAERPVTAYAHYTASKAALLGLTRALAVELAPAIRVCGVSPGTVLFPEDYDDEERARILARIPLRREGSADDIADAVSYLVNAEYVNGHIVDVDGGRKVRL